MKRLVSKLFFAVWMAAASASFAQAPAVPEGFEPIKGKEARAESVDASTLVVAAYGAIFVLMFGFVIHVVRGQAEISRQMQALAKKLDGGGK